MTQLQERVLKTWKARQLASQPNSLSSALTTPIAVHRTTTVANNPFFTGCLPKMRRQCAQRRQKFALQIVILV
jgi:hypothetical protein